MNKVQNKNQNIAHAILKIRQDNKLSQEEFAEIVKVTRQAVSRWEMGISVPNINTLILIGEKFNISIDSLLQGAEITHKHKKGRLKVKINYDVVLIFIGTLGIISIPFLADLKQAKNMELYKTAYEHSYDYILEYPLFIILILAFAFISLGTYLLIIKKHKK